MEISVTTRAGTLAVDNKEVFASQIALITEAYQDLVVTDKAEAKRDRATINKLLKAIDDKRKEAKREYEAPFKAFEAELKELTEPLKEAGEAIDAQIKAIEESERLERKAWIEEQYSELPTDIPLSDVWDEAWLNSSVSKQRVKAELTSAIITAQASQIKPVAYNGNGIPVYNMEEPHTVALNISCTTSQLEVIEAFLDKLGVFYWEADNGTES